MPVNTDFKLLLQHFIDSVFCLDHNVSMPLFNENFNDKLVFKFYFLYDIFF